jgi:5-methylcytosine-specific restriction endonuclease McrA
MTTDPTNTARQRRWYARQKAGTPWQPLTCQACGANCKGVHGALCSRCWLKTDVGREWQKNRVKEFRASNPESTAKNTYEGNRKRSAFRRAGRRNALVPLTCDQLKERFALFGNACAYCGNGGQMTIDHVTPLSSNGLDEFANIVPACKRCNSSKNCKEVSTWYQSQPFFTGARWRKIERHCSSQFNGQLSIALPEVNQ